MAKQGIGMAKAVAKMAAEQKRATTIMDKQARGEATVAQVVDALRAVARTHREGTEAMIDDDMPENETIVGVFIAMDTLAAALDGAAIYLGIPRPDGARPTEAEVLDNVRTLSFAHGVMATVIADKVQELTVRKMVGLDGIGAPGVGIMAITGEQAAALLRGGVANDRKADD